MIQNTKTILVITLSNIGDAIMTTPLLERLHRLYPDAKIDLVVDRKSSALFEHCPYRGSILEKDKSALLRGTPGLLNVLFRKKYDLAIDLRTDMLVFFLRARKKLNKRNSDPKAIHSVEKHLSVIKEISGDNTTENCRVWPGPDDIKYARQVLGRLVKEKNLCIAPGANSPKKIWAWQNYRQLLGRPEINFNNVILLGSANDNLIAEKITENRDKKMLNLCGKTTLLEAAAVMQHMSLFIGNDSGLGHMAAATGVPTCTLFGPGQPERYRPWGERAVWIKGKNQQINAIEVNDIIAVLEKNSLLA